MNSGKTIFSQLMDFLPMYEFQKCVERYNGHYKIKSFSCWDQFLCLAFAQLTYHINDHFPLSPIELFLIS